jgi:phosphoribosylglycinamide formyltransferase-1
MKTIAFLVSGGGGTFRFVQQYLQHSPTTSLRIVAVIADRPCQAVEDAKVVAIPTFMVQYRPNASQNLLQLMQQLQPDIIITTFLQLISADIIADFKGRLLNLHYSLLPAFKGYYGANTVRAIIESGVVETGTTVHEVSEGLDEGAIIAQNRFPIPSNHSFESIMDLVFKAGCLNLMNVLLNLQNTSVDINKPEFTPKLQFTQPYLLNNELLHPTFWQKVQTAFTKP